MNYEIQILFKELIDSVNGVTYKLDQLKEIVDSPDGWGVGATIGATLAAALVTWKLGRRQEKLQGQQLKIQERQNDLQEQQVKLQEQQNSLQERQLRAEEYNIYRGLYEVIFSIHKATEGFAIKIYTILASDGNVKVWTWEDVRKDITKLQTDLDLKSIDIDLKFPEYSYLSESYKLILSLMDGILFRVEKFEKEGFINSAIIVDTSTMISNINRGNKQLIQLISENIKDDKERNNLTQAFIALYTYYENIQKTSFLNEVKDKI